MVEGGQAAFGPSIRATCSIAGMMMQTASNQCSCADEEEAQLAAAEALHVSPSEALQLVSNGPDGIEDVQPMTEYASQGLSNGVPRHDSPHRDPSAARPLSQVSSKSKGFICISRQSLLLAERCLTPGPQHHQQPRACSLTAVTHEGIHGRASRSITHPGPMRTITLEAPILAPTATCRCACSGLHHVGTLALQ